MPKEKGSQKSARERVLAAASKVLGVPVSKLIYYTTQLTEKQYGRFMKAMNIARVMGYHGGPVFLGVILAQFEAMEDAMLPRAQRKNSSHG